MLKNKDEIHAIYFSLGSNIGDSRLTITNAYNLISETIGNIVSVSSFYKTQPWGNTKQSYFLNSACKVHTQLPPIACLKSIQNIEKKLGRTRASKWEARIIDIDILFYDDALINDIWLLVPHPYVAMRKFVLEPMCEIEPELIHPVYNKKIELLLKECTDTSYVSRIDDMSTIQESNVSETTIEDFE